jgi:hypothetical protein
VKGREEPGEWRSSGERAGRCPGYGGSSGERAGRCPGYCGSTGVKGREEPGVRRIHWCEVQGGARGTKDPLV